MRTLPQNQNQNTPRNLKRVKGGVTSDAQSTTPPSAQIPRLLLVFKELGLPNLPLPLRQPGLLVANILLLSRQEWDYLRLLKILWVIWLWQPDLWQLDQ